MHDLAGKRSTIWDQGRQAAAGPAPGKRTLTEMLPPPSGPVQRKVAVSALAPVMPSGPQPTIQDLFGSVQCKAAGTEQDTAAIHASPQQAQLQPLDDTAQVHRAAEHGTRGPGGTLPHAGTIQRLFGRHDISGIQSHDDAHAAHASKAIGAKAFAVGEHVAFGEAPTLHTAAHEAAHVVQQRAGVHLKGGVGASGDAYEQHADRVADLVVQGQSAEAELDRMAGPSSPGRANAGAVQMKPLYVPMRPKQSNQPEESNQEGMEWQPGEMIETDDYTVVQLIELLLEMNRHFHRGAYQALELEIALRRVKEAEPGERKQKAQAKLDELTTEQRRPLPISEHSADPDMKPQPSSRGQLGAMNEFTVSMGRASEQSRGNTRRMLIPNGPTWLLDDGQVPDGHYAYVTHLNRLIVVWPCDPSGKNTFHSGLSYFAPEVGYAGTVQFVQGTVVRWNADSGTYKPKVEDKDQSGLPGDKFQRGLGY